MMRQLRRSGMVVSILSFLLIFASCGGGSAGGDTDRQLTGIQDRFDEQSSTAVSLFDSMGTLMRSMNAVTETLAELDPADDDAQTRIIREFEDEILPMTTEVSALAGLMAELESELQGVSPIAAQGATIRKRLPHVAPTAVLSTVVMGVCAVGTLTAFHISLEDALETYRQDVDRCIALWEQYERNRPPEQTPEEWAAYTQAKFDVFDACHDMAVERYNSSGIWASLGGGLGLVGSNIPVSSAGRFTVGFASSYLDAAQIYLWGKRSDNGIQIDQTGRRDVQASVGYENDLEMFITTVDGSGAFTAPEGEWDIVVFRNDFVRLGNPQGEPIHFYADETTEIPIHPVPVDEVTSSDLTCGNDDGLPDDPPDPDDDPAAGGSMSGQFSATCSDGYSDSSDFSVTISNDNVVTGTYDYGNISGGVSDGFMSVTLDGFWSDCVLGGYVSGSGDSLSGSGQVSCSGGSCYGTWSAGN